MNNGTIKPFLDFNAVKKCKQKSVKQKAIFKNAGSFVTYLVMAIIIYSTIYTLT